MKRISSFVLCFIIIISGFSSFATIEYQNTDVANYVGLSGKYIMSYQDWLNWNIDLSSVHSYLKAEQNKWDGFNITEQVNSEVQAFYSNQGTNTYNRKYVKIFVGKSGNKTYLYLISDKNPKFHFLKSVDGSYESILIPLCNPLNGNSSDYEINICRWYYDDVTNTIKKQSAIGASVVHLSGFGVSSMSLSDSYEYYFAQPKIFYSYAILSHADFSYSLTTSQDYDISPRIYSKIGNGDITFNTYVQSTYSLRFNNNDGQNILITLSPNNPQVDTRVTMSIRNDGLMTYKVSGTDLVYTDNNEIIVTNTSNSIVSRVNITSQDWVPPPSGDDGGASSGGGVFDNITSSKPLPPDDTSGWAFDDWLVYYFKLLLYWVSMPFKLLGGLISGILSDIGSVFSGFGGLIKACSELVSFIPSSIMTVASIGLGLSIIKFFIKR